MRRMRRMRDGDDRAFDELFRAEYPLMVRTAHLIVGDQELAREIAQESFARLLARWDQIATYDKPGAWLRLVTVRQAVRVKDRRRREDLVLVPDRARAVGGGGAVERVDLIDALRQLSVHQRAAIVLHELHDLPVDEVARHLGTSPSTVKTHLARARARLAEVLATEVDDVL